MENSVDNLRASTFSSIKFDLSELFLSPLISSIPEKRVSDKRQEKERLKKYGILRTDKQNFEPPINLVDAF